MENTNRQQLTIFDELCEEVKITKPIRLIELFSGYGSQAMALERVGANFTRYKAIEFDKFAMNSYNAIHGTNFKVTDIRDINAEYLEVTDTNNYCYIMTYSFPCTDLSIAGKMKGMKKGSGTRSGLLWEVERLLKGMDEKPQVLLMENVPQVHGKRNKDDFQKWISFLESIGYKNFWKDLNAKDFGVPQNRKRCFMVSLLGNYTYHFPNPKNDTSIKISDLLEDIVEEKYYLHSEKAKKLIEQLIARNVLTESVEKMQKINVVGTMDNTFESANRVYSVKGIAPTIHTCTGGTGIKILTDEYRIRKLTPRECGRLMGVSDEDIDKMAAVNSNTQLYKQFGNSIVVDVLCAIFKQLNIEQEKEKND